MDYLVQIIKFIEEWQEKSESADELNLAYQLRSFIAGMVDDYNEGQDAQYN